MLGLCIVCWGFPPMELSEGSLGSGLGKLSDGRAGRAYGFSPRGAPQGELSRKYARPEFPIIGGFRFSPFV